MFTAALQELLVLGPLVADADQESAIGVSDTEIRIGNIMPWGGRVKPNRSHRPRL
jgi:hypothetical protein